MTNALCAWFRRHVNEIFYLVGYYTAWSNSYRRFEQTVGPIFKDDGTDRLSKRTVTNYQSMLNNIPEDRKSQMLFTFIISISLSAVIAAGPSGFRIRAKAKNFTFPKNVQTGSGAKPVSCFFEYRRTFSWTKRLGRESNE